MFFNKNANNPNVWTFEPDLESSGVQGHPLQGGDARLTWQVSPRNKLGILAADQSGCTCVGVVSATVAPGLTSANASHSAAQLLDWTSPVTNRLLLEAGVRQHFGRGVRLPSVDTNPQMITVNEQSTGLRYRAADTPQRAEIHAIHLRFGASYITGGACLQGRFYARNGFEAARHRTNGGQPLTYRFNGASPTSSPSARCRCTDKSTSITISRSTPRTNGACGHDGQLWPPLRLFREQLSSAARGTGNPRPDARSHIPCAEQLAWHDISPRLG